MILVLLIVAVVLVGTWPLTIIGKIFEALAKAFNWLAQLLNIFGWNGLI